MTQHADSIVLVVGLSRASVDAAIESRLGDPPRSPVRFQPMLRSGDGPDGAWLGLLRAMSSAAESGLLHRSPLAAAGFEQALISALVDTHAHDLAGSLTRASRTMLPRALRRAMAYCERHASEAVSTSDLALAARVSVPTLRQGFRTHLSMTPTEYLRLVRLDLAHRDLTAIAHGEATGRVVDVALRWGFPHLGRFAASYRSIYGQSPSRTLGHRPGPATSVPD